LYYKWGFMAKSGVPRRTCKTKVEGITGIVLGGWTLILHQRYLRRWKYGTGFFDIFPFNWAFRNAE
jgi:hypothetical protein